MANSPPAARAVLDAYWTEADRLNRDANREILAVAFHVAADRLIPHPTRTPWIGPNDEEPYFNETFENYEALGELTIVEQLRQIASELNPKFREGRSPRPGTGAAGDTRTQPNPPRPPTAMTTPPPPFTTRLPDPVDNCMSPLHGNLGVFRGWELGVNAV